MWIGDDEHSVIGLECFIITWSDTCVCVWHKHVSWIPIANTHIAPVFCVYGGRSRLIIHSVRTGLTVAVQDIHNVRNECRRIEWTFRSITQPLCVCSCKFRGLCVAQWSLNDTTWIHKNDGKPKADANYYAKKKKNTIRRKYETFSLFFFFWFLYLLSEQIGQIVCLECQHKWLSSSDDVAIRLSLCFVSDKEYLIARSACMV